MALLKLGGLVTQISGRIGGNILGTSPNGSYIKSNSYSQQHPSAAQSLQRTQIYPVTQNWGQLTVTQKNTFIAGVSDYPYINKVGDTVLYTGYQLHNLLNQGRLLIGSSLLTSLPTLYDQVVSYTVFLTCDTTKFYYTISFTGRPVYVRFYLAPPSTNGTIPKPQDYKFQYSLYTSSGTFSSSVNYTSFNDYPNPVSGDVLYAYFRVIDSVSGYTVFTSAVQNHTVV